MVELVDLVNSVIIFRSKTTWVTLLTFLLEYLTVILTFYLFWSCFSHGALAFVLKWPGGMSGASQIVVLDISKVFARVWHLVLFFGLSSSFLGNQRHRMVVNGKSASEFLSMLICFSASFWDLSFFPAINWWSS